MRTRRIRALTRHDIEHISRRCYHELRRLAGDDLSEEGLRLVAARLNIAIVAIANDAGRYLPPPCPDLPSIVAVNTTLSPRRRRRILIHEITHHLLHYYIPNALFNADVVFCHEQDGHHVRHRIAQCVDREH